jgi:proline iminopeptidase
MWENALATIDYDGMVGEAPAEYARAFARLENHYFSQGCFIDEGQILRDRTRIEHIRAIIVQGRFDMICPPEGAWRLKQGWPRAELRMVPAAGHALSEVGITAALVAATNRLRDAALA